MRGARPDARELSQPTARSSRAHRRSADPRRLPLTTISQASFDARLDRLGPFEARPHVAVAVSGGADSLALALLTDRWARPRGGRVSGLVVDHGIRPEAAGEAGATVRRLRERGIDAAILRLAGLHRGPRLAERARAARYEVLERECARRGIVHLLLGHHAGDQAETVLMRMRAGSHAAGLAGMAALRETALLRLLRPLLDVAPVALRTLLAEEAMSWVEDPSNRDPASERARVRAARDDADGTGPATAVLCADAAARGAARAEADRRRAAELAERATFMPEGYVVVRGSRLSADALAAIVAAVSGSPRRLALPRVASLAALLRPATIGGTRLMEAGRLAPGGWLLVREAAAVAPPAAAAADTVWDRRFRLRTAAVGATIGAVGPDAPALRDLTELPAAILAVLPALRRQGRLIAVPHVPAFGLGTAGAETIVDALWAPPLPAADMSFAPAGRPV